MRLRLQNVNLPFQEFALELNVEMSGPVTAIFGPSGAGKTSCLDLIAGLRRPQSAKIEFDGIVLQNSEQGTFVPPRLRRIGYVPQDLALFPHLSVRKNLLYGCAEPNHAGLCSLDRVIKVVEIEGLLERGIGQLSGGERQRVALGRALVSAPRLLLLDEPLASLDEALKTKIIPYLLRVRDDFGVPMLYVTHDPREVAALCNEVLELQRGKLVRQSSIQNWKNS